MSKKKGDPLLTLTVNHPVVMYKVTFDRSPADEEVQPSRGVGVAARAGEEVGREVPADAAQAQQERIQAQPG